MENNEKSKIQTSLEPDLFGRKGSDNFPYPNPGFLLRSASEISSNNSNKPIPLPRTIKTVDLDAKPLPPKRSVSLSRGFTNPIYAVVNQENPDASVASNLLDFHPTATGNCYEEVNDNNFRNNSTPEKIDVNLYGTVTDPKSSIHNSLDLLTNIQFESPFEEPFHNFGQKSSQSFFQDIEDFDIDPPSYPPPPLPKFEDNFEPSFCDDFDCQEFVPAIPPRPQSSLSSSSEGSGSFNIEIKPVLPAKKSIGASAAILPAPIYPARRAPSRPKEVVGRPKLQPPKPPRKSKELKAKISRKDLFSCEDYLYITGSHFTKQEFLWRWCVLDEEQLNFHEDSESLSPRGEINCSDIISLSLARIKKPENLPELHSFTLHTTKDGGKQYIIGATFPSVRNKWLTKIVGAVAPDPLLPLISKLNNSELDKRKEFCRAGQLFMKEGISGSWQKVFFVLQHNERVLHISTIEDCSAIDLRKVINIKMKQINDVSLGCSEALQVGHIFHIDLPGRAIYLQSHLRNDTLSWFHALNRCLASGNGDILKNVQLTQDDVPVIIDKLTKFVSTYGGTREGIYRLGAQDSKIKKLVASFSTDAWAIHLKQDEVTVEEAANALKRYLRSLTECLLTNSLFSYWIGASTVLPQDERLLTYKKLLQKLPGVNYCTLKYLIGHLVSISSQANQNKMNSSNLASVFGPTLLFQSNSNMDSDLDFKIANQKMDLINDFINFYADLFGIDNAELEKEKKINNALEKLKQIQLDQKPAGDILVGIYVMRSSGKCQNIRIPPSMKAVDVIAKVAEQAGITKNVDKLVLYEVICGGELERIIQSEEFVLPVVLQWSSWNPELTKENHLVIKENDFLCMLKPQLQVPTSLFSELKYADSKSKTFRKAFFEFSGARLSYYKDTRSSNTLGIWNIEDINWFIGSELRRSAPTRWSFTFIEKNPSKRSKDNYFGTTVCCNSEDEYNKWLSAMLVAEYPGIFKTI